MAKSDFGFQTQLILSPSMSREEEEEEYDDSWEVRAFEEDTRGNALGCTWPPRSYTCNFCRREFRSAQALGGHMNVHRRDRARLHDAPPLPPPPALLIPTRGGQEFVANGLCLIYPLPNPSSILFTPPPMDSFPAATAPNSVVSNPVCRHPEPSASNSSIGNNYEENGKDIRNIQEEVDLELRLGSSR